MLQYYRDLDKIFGPNLLFYTCMRWIGLYGQYVGPLITERKVLAWNDVLCRFDNWCLHLAQILTKLTPNTLHGIIGKCHNTIDRHESWLDRFYILETPIHNSGKQGIWTIIRELSDHVAAFIKVHLRKMRLPVENSLIRRYSINIIPRKPCTRLGELRSTILLRNHGHIEWLAWKLSLRPTWIVHDNNEPSGEKPMLANLKDWKC